MQILGPSPHNRWLIGTSEMSPRILRVIFLSPSSKPETHHQALGEVARVTEVAESGAGGTQHWVSKHSAQALTVRTVGTGENWVRMSLSTLPDTLKRQNRVPADRLGRTCATCQSCAYSGKGASLT